MADPRVSAPPVTPYHAPTPTPALAPMPLPLAGRQRQQYAPPRTPERQAGLPAPDMRWAAFLPVPGVGVPLTAAGAAAQMALSSTPPPSLSTPPPTRRASPADEAASFYPQGAMLSALSAKGMSSAGPVGQYYASRAEALRDLSDFIDGLPPEQSMPQEELNAFIQGYLEAMQSTGPASTRPNETIRVAEQTFSDAITDPSSPIYQEMAKHIEAEGPWALYKYAIEPIAMVKGYDQAYLKALPRGFAEHVAQWQKAQYEAKMRGTAAPTFQQYLASVGYRV